MQFTRLRLSGFKSFVDQTDLVIAPGLTGIVGPNGCGKSNLVEALRWVMGETSAKRMRGTEMDDVIFGGTSDRPPRNLAEVTLTLDNQARTAPAAFNAYDQLEVRRKIEREKGSDYRVNGKPTRARDVQLLFQDNSTGSNSPALVSQGRVGALIGAKPADRRLLLEDAAGVAGLHSRRHEAELRLKAAESNLERLEDVVRAMDGQLGSLKRQAKQAQRYRELSEKIRTTEAALLFLHWETGDRRLAAARHGHGEADKRVGEAMQIAAAAATAQAEAAAQVPPAREREAESAAALQRLIIAREQVQAEAKRIQDQTKDTGQRLVQLQGDLAREASLGDDAAQALARLAEEEAQIRTAQSGEGAAVDAAESGLAGARTVVESLEGDLTRLTEAVAIDEATARALAKQVSEQQTRHQSLTGKVDAACAERNRLAAATAQTQAALTAADEALAAAEAALIEKRAAAEAADQARMAAEQTLTETRGLFQQLDQESGRLKAEAAGLSQALSGKGSERQGTPILDQLQVDSGAEAALGAAFAEDLSAPGERLGARWWEALPPLEDAAALPAGIPPLAMRVSGPAALQRALGLVGVAPDRETALALAGSLRAGQSLVTLEGDLVRWDGFTVLAGAPSAAAVRLQQRNRLAALEAGIEDGKEALESARRGFDAARTDLGTAAQAAADGRRAADAAFQARNRAVESQTRQARAAGDGEGRRVQAARRAEELAGDLEAVAQALSELRANEAALPDLGQRREDIAQLRRQVAEARGDLAGAQATREGLKRETDARRDRLNRIETERRSWTDRASGAGKRIRELEARRDSLSADLEKLKAEPSRLSAQLSGLADQIDEAEIRRKRNADALAVAETAQRDTDRTLKDAEQRLAQRREARLSAEAEVRAAHTALEALAERIQERLDCGPDRLAALAGLDPAAERPHPKTVESQMQRLLGERDALGPVNLRAEQESEELDEQVQALKSEREDLIAAIARLRQGIAGLNKEAKERLLAAFDLVHGHFSDLFVRLFGGGKAELKLTDPEDPLACGLEIYASPPGKRLQHLSLLSGGEQALTAVALLFAVFLTKPSPICVLDEVDAPLDDANVDRFCTLVEELAKEARTRFLVITHHRMTMARADRLFGVTMGERGVSQLVSVDLEAAAKLRDDILGETVGGSAQGLEFPLCPIWVELGGIWRSCPESD